MCSSTSLPIRSNARGAYQERQEEEQRAREKEAGQLSSKQQAAARQAVLRLSAPPSTRATPLHMHAPMQAPELGYCACTPACSCYFGRKRRPTTKRGLKNDAFISLRWIWLWLASTQIRAIVAMG